MRPGRRPGWIIAAAMAVTWLVSSLAGELIQTNPPGHRAEFSSCDLHFRFEKLTILRKELEARTGA